MRHAKRTWPKWSAPALMLGLLAAAAVPAAGATPAPLDSTGTVRIVLSYRNAEGERVRLPGVEVLLLEVSPGRHMGPIWHQRGHERYVCSNANGVATFRDVPAGISLWAVAGVGHPGVCANAEFLNPSNGKKLLSVDWRKVGGGGFYSPFSIMPDEVRGISIFVPTPARQDEICGGFWATWIGTPGNDVFRSTGDEADVVIAGEGNDIIDSGDGWDVICAGPGNDIVRASEDGDVLFGEGGADTLNGQSGADWLFGGEGADACYRGEWLAGCEATD